MIVSEYHHFVMPNKLVDLDIENQWLLTSHSQRLGDKRSFTTWHLAKQFKPKWDPASGSSCQSAGNTEVRGIQDMPCTRHHRVKTTGQGTSLAVRWLRHHASTAGALVWSPVGELRSRMSRGVAKRKTKKQKTNQKKTGTTGHVAQALPPINFKEKKRMEGEPVD